MILSLTSLKEKKVFEETDKQRIEYKRIESDKLTAWVIGPYLVIQISLLSYLALGTWLAPDWKTLSQLIPLPLFSLEPLWQSIQPQKFHTFQSIILASCAAGIGGAVFMVRSFYLNFAYGRENDQQEVNFLQNREIPRYILLPFSSIVLGPIALGLLLSGSIIFSGFATEKEIPYFSAVIIGFLLGFSYHDSLKLLRNLSRQIFDRRDGNRGDS